MLRNNFNARFIFYFKYLLTTNIPKETEGPIPKANTIVPIPTTPPRYQPIITTLISIIALIKEIGLLVILCNPVIKPSLDPGPRLATKYKPLPNPTITTAKIICNI